MDKLQELERRVPIASDKALINLVNGIQVNRELIFYKKSRGFFGKIFDNLVGKDRERQTLIDGNLIAGQEALCNWVTELTDSLRISQIALELTQNSLLEARIAIRKQKEYFSNQKKDLALLDIKLNELTHKIENRLLNFEDRIRNLELNAAAQKDFELIITSWEAKLTYVNLPWIIQTIMLIKEIFSSAVAKYELHTNDKVTYRRLLVNKILSANKTINSKFFSLPDLLELTWQQAKILDDIELSLGILEIRSLPNSRIQNMPLTFTLATTLELAALAKDIRPPKPARCAVELCRTQIKEIDYTTTIHEFITQITHEVANDNFFLRVKD